MTVVRGIKVEENTEYIWIWNQEDAIRVSTNIYIYIYLKWQRSMVRIKYYLFLLICFNIFVINTIIDVCSIKSFKALKIDSIPVSLQNWFYPR